ncbi:DUF397 domain-containing protein [Salinactinospora qingdaonensis]|uniref:DUF397 domain-containing protein n=1 Tax=Salinactinospora qingdaonensis TaxID=702744 RepID=UPI0031EA642A
MSAHTAETEEACVEVAGLPNATLIRDTQNRRLGHLAFISTGWQASLEALKNSKI